MAAVVRSFLQQDRSRFVDLLRAVYADEPFTGIPTGPGVLLGARLDQRAKKEAHYAGEYLTTWDLDFVLSRSPGTLLKLRSPDMYEARMDVHVADSESALRDEGDLALDADGLAYVARKVAGAPTATITRVRPGRVPAAVAAVNAQLAGGTPYVYAFIQSYSAWLTASEDPRARTFTGPPVPPEPIWGRTAPEGEHIIAINGPIRAEGAEYAVPVWTWATAFEVRIPADRMAGYLPIYVHGSLR